MLSWKLSIFLMFVTMLASAGNYLWQANCMVNQAMAISQLTINETQITAIEKELLYIYECLLVHEMPENALYII